MKEKPASQTSVAAQVVQLPSLSIDELWSIWDRYFSSRPPNANRTLVEARLAYKMQEVAFGGLDPKLKQRLEEIGAQDSRIPLRAQLRDHHFAPGTILMRQWGNREHKVTVNAEGRFEYEGLNFKSLTAVARHITGAHWSGPLFFNLGNGSANGSTQ